MIQHHQVYVDGFLDGQIFIITGGGTGIGRETALLAAQLGAKIAICGRRIEPLEQTSKEIMTKFKTEVYFAKCDIREYEQVEKFVEEVMKKFGRIDVLINNAGGQFPIAAELLTPKGFNAVVRNNLLGTWNMTIATALKAFIPQNKGCILNIVAVMLNGFPGMVHTGAARAGVDNMTKTLAIEWARFGIRVNAIAPGIIISSGTKQYDPSFLTSGINATPLQRAGTTEDVALLTLFLCSEKTSNFITGQTYYLDGALGINGHQVSLVPKPKL